MIYLPAPLSPALAGPSHIPERKERPASPGVVGDAGRRSCILCGMKRWLANVVASSPAWSPPVRRRILGLAGAQVSGAWIEGRGTYQGDLGRLTIGDGTFVNIGCRFFSNGGITVGCDVAFGPDVLVMTGTHAIGPATKRASDPTTYAPVVIGDGAWIGARAVIQGGVTIGAGCVVAPGAVVTADCERNGFYAGVPAVRKRDLPAE